MEELNISLQDISIDGTSILYQIVKLNVLYHMSFSVSYSSNIICITPLFDAILSDKSGRGFSTDLGFSRFYFRGIKASAEERDSRLGLALGFFSGERYKALTACAIRASLNMNIPLSWIDKGPVRKLAGISVETFLRFVMSRELQIFT